jgi:hypothetical protein
MMDSVPMPEPQNPQVPLQYWQPESPPTPAVILVLAAIISAAFSAVGVFIPGFIIGAGFLGAFNGEALRHAQERAATAGAGGCLTLAGWAIIRAIKIIRSRRLPISERRCVRTFIVIGLLFGSALSCVLLSLFWMLAVFAD